MEAQQIWNLIVWENVSEIPFPEEVKKVTSKIAWDKYEWHTCNLPIPFAKYSVVGGKTLYLAELPNGEIKVEKQDYTGDIFMVSYFINDGSGEYNYFVAFKVTFVKGEVLEITLDRLDKQPTQEYTEAMDRMKVLMAQQIKKIDSWWFKWLYRPYWHCVRGVFFVPLVILNFLRLALVKVVNWLTPW